MSTTVKNNASSGKLLIALGVIGIIACLAAIATSFPKTSCVGVARVVV